MSVPTRRARLPSSASNALSARNRSPNSRMRSCAEKVLSDGAEPPRGPQREAEAQSVRTSAGASRGAHSIGKPTHDTGRFSSSGGIGSDDVLSGTGCRHPQRDAHDEEIEGLAVRVGAASRVATRVAVDVTTRPSPPQPGLEWPRRSVDGHQVELEVTYPSLGREFDASNAGTSLSFIVCVEGVRSSGCQRIRAGSEGPGEHPRLSDAVDQSEVSSI